MGEEGIWKVVVAGVEDCYYVVSDVLGVLFKKKVNHLFPGLYSML